MPPATNSEDPRRSFAACDLNGGGFIDPDEFYTLLQKLDNDVSPAEALLDFEAADTDMNRFRQLHPT